MNDELDRLKAALKSTPDPDADAKSAAIALARKNFADLQGSADSARLTKDSPMKAGFLSGAKKMLHTQNLRPLLYATSSIAVIGVGLVLVLPMDRLVPELRPIGGVTERVTMREQDAASNSDDLVAAEPVLEPAPLFAEAEVSSESGVPAALSKRKSVGALAIADAEPPALGTEDRERFANDAENPLKITSEDPVSTFSIDVDTASYAYVRSAITGGQMPDPAAIRIEELVNYFPYTYPAPTTGDDPFATSVAVFETPWNAETKLLRIGIQGEKPAVEDRPALDLVFLIDTSGSMQSPDKLPLLKQSFRLLLSKLRAEDKVSIVTYAGSSGLVLEPTAADDTATILAALDQLEAGGATAGAAGIQLAYQQATRMRAEGRIGRILLATDGDFNVGISDPDALKSYVEQQRELGTYLSVLGFGRGNYNDALLQALAQNGNGTAAYIDTLSEAQKVLVDQVSGALFPIANDVKIQVEFNAAQIAEYRLIGYETRALNREDFNNDRVDAGDIGAGHSVTALYEITPVGSPAILNDPLRFSGATEAVSISQDYAFVKLRYKEPGTTTSRLITTPVSPSAERADEDARFAAAIAGFGQLLRGGKYLGDWSFQDAITLANNAKGDDAFGYRTEAVQLMRLAESLAK